MQHVKSTMMKKISNIRKKNNKYIITLGDNTQLEFYSETLIKYNLLKPRDLTDLELKELIEYNNYYEAFNKALKLISAKQRTKKELINKLNNYSKNIIESVIKKLEELNYLNEQIYIKSYINDQINLGTKGPNYIKRELERLELNSNYINEALSLIDENIWQEKANKIACKKINVNKKLSKSALIIKVKHDLLNLGYEKETISNVINEIDFEENNEILLKEYQKEIKRLSKKYNGKELETKIKYNLYKKGFSYSDIDKIQNKY